MYIGFDFGTIQEAQYSNREYVCGSTNILLLALTRGFMKLHENLHPSASNQKITENHIGMVLQHGMQKHSRNLMYTEMIAKRIQQKNGNRTGHLEKSDNE